MFLDFKNKKLNLKLGKKKAIILLVIFLSFISIGLTVNSSRYHIDADAMSYISIAEHYARGDIKTAVNGYWSPGISFLMAPLISLGLDGRLAFAIINALSAAAIIILGSGIIWIASRKNLLAALTYLIGATIFLIAAIPSFHPDLLLAAWVVLFIVTLFFADNRFTHHTLRFDIIAGTVLGAVGGLGYLTKLYALPFFIVTVAMWAVVRFVKYANKSNIGSIKTWVLGFRMATISAVVFVIFITPWMAALTMKYNYFTLGSAGIISTNSKFLEPVGTNYDTIDKTKTVNDKPKTPSKVLAPPYSTATTTSEDLTPIGKPKQSSLSTVGLKQGLKNYIEGRKQGVPLYINNLQKMWPLLLAIIIGLTSVLIIAKRKYNMHKFIYLSLLSFGTYFTGYAMIAGFRGGNIRYYWPLMIIGIILAALIVGILAKSSRSLYKYVSVLVAILIVSSLLTTYGKGDLNQLTTPPTQSKLEKVAYKFTSEHPVSQYDDFLSNNGRQNKNFAFYVDGQAYGSPDAGHEFTQPQLRELLAENGIDYFLHFTDKEKLDFDPETFGGKLLGKYSLGNRFLCKDIRKSVATKCTLYVIKPVY